MNLTAFITQNGMFVCLLLPPAVKYAGTSLKSSYHTIESIHIFCLHLIVSRKDMKIKCYFSPGAEGSADLRHFPAPWVSPSRTRVHERGYTEAQGGLPQPQGAQVLSYYVKVILREKVQPMSWCEEGGV